MTARDRLLDFGLTAMVSETDTVFLCATDPVSYAAAAASHVGQKTGSRGSMFFAITSPAGGGRQASLAAFSDGATTANGTANYVAIGDSVLQNLFVTETLAQPQTVQASNAFSLISLQIIMGASTQPQAGSFATGSPVISSVVFTRLQPATVGVTTASPVFGAPILIAAQTIWTNITIPNVVGLFVVEYDAVPPALALDNLTGLSNGPAAAFVDMACIVRFSNLSVIDVRNGAAYAAAASVPYTAGQQFHIRIVGNINAHTYNVFAKPLGQAEVQIAVNYAFRSEQALVPQLNNFAVSTNDIGKIVVSNLTFNSVVATPLVVGSPSIPVIAYNGKLTFISPDLAVGGALVFSKPALIDKRSFQVGTMTLGSPVFVRPALTINVGQAAGAFTAQTNDFTISWDASAAAAAEDATFGLANGAPAAYTDFACLVRFSNTSVIECRNGGVYAASLSVAYAPGTNYHFRLIVRLSNHTYDVYCTPQGQAEVLLANNFAFRSEQSGITTLSFLGKLVLAGDAILSNMTNPSPVALAPVVNAQTLALVTNGGLWVAGDQVGTMTASYVPTAWAITAGNTAGNFAISNAGVITVTSAGITALAGLTGTAALTVRATNAFGNGTGTATINYAPAAAAFPDLTNTGVPSGTVLTAYTGPMSITTANTTVDSKTITGDLDISAAGVTISRCRITASFWGIRSGTFPFTVTDCEIIGPAGVDSGAGIGCDAGGTFTRLNIHQWSNGIQAGGAGSVRDCYIWSLVDVTSHPDGIAFSGVADGFLIDHCTIVGRGNSATWMTTDWGSLNNITVNNCKLLCEPGDFPPWTFAVDQKAAGLASGWTITNITCSNCLIQKGLNDYMSFVAPNNSPANAVPVNWTNNRDYLTNVIIPAPGGASPPVVTNNTFSLATVGGSWVAGDVVGTMSATNLPTAWSITAGNASGFFAISNSGVITVLSAGITGLGGASGTASLTVQATNSGGSGTGTATINYQPTAGYNNLTNFPGSANRPVYTSGNNTLTWIGPIGGGASTANDTQQTQVLTPFTGDFRTTSNGQVVQNMHVDGTITIAHANVILRKCYLISGDFFPIVTDENHLYGTGTDATNCLVEDCEFFSANSGITQSPRIAQGTFRRCNFHGAENGMTIVGDNVIVKDTWVHGMGGPITGHTDVVEAHGGTTSLTYDHCTITQDWPNFSGGAAGPCFYLGCDNGTLTNSTFNNNLMVVSGNGNFTMQLDPKSFSINTISITNNLMGKGVTGTYVTTGSLINFTWTNNRDYATNALIPTP